MSNAILVTPEDLQGPYEGRPVFSLVQSEDCTADQKSKAPDQEDVLTTNVEIFCHTAALPVVNRYRYLISEVPDFSAIDSTEFLDADELAANLNMTLESLQQLIEELNVPPYMLCTDAFKNLQLAPGLRTIIEEELQWRAAYNDANPLITVKQHSLLSGMPYEAAKEALNRYGVEFLKQGQWRLSPKEYSYRLRAELMMFPPARNELLVREFASAMGRSAAKSLYDLFENHNFPEDYFRMRSSNHRVMPHYSADVLEEVKELVITAPPVSEDMVAVYSIARTLGRSNRWVKSQIRTLHRHKKFGASGRARPTDYYPLWVIDELAKVSQANLELPPIDDEDMTVSRICNKLDLRSHHTVERILERLQAQPTYKLLSNNREVATYEGSIIDEVRVTLVKDIESDLERVVAHVDVLKTRVPQDVDTRRRLAAAERHLEQLRQRLDHLCSRNEEVSSTFEA